MTHTSYPFSFVFSSRAAVGVSIFLIAAAGVLRLLPHAPNVAPIGAIALFSGAVLGRRYVWVPLAALAVGDMFLGGYDLRVMASVYGSFLMIGIAGTFLSEVRLGKKNTAVVAGTSVVGSVLFFLITNAAVWAFSGMYEPTIAGLWHSYVMGLPFFRNTILGDLFFNFILFGGYWSVVYYRGQKRAWGPAVSTQREGI